MQTVLYTYIYIKGERETTNFNQRFMIKKLNYIIDDSIVSYKHARVVTKLSAVMLEQRNGPLFAFNDLLSIPSNTIVDSRSRLHYIHMC